MGHHDELRLTSKMSCLCVRSIMHIETRTPIAVNVALKKVCDWYYPLRPTTRELGAFAPTIAVGKEASTGTTP